MKLFLIAEYTYIGWSYYMTHIYLVEVLLEDIRNIILQSTYQLQQFSAILQEAVFRLTADE